MFATYQVCFDVPFAEELAEWAQGLPWSVWAGLGGLLYLLGFRAAGRVVAGLASTPGGRVASALAWPLTLALFPVCRAASAVGRTVLAPAVGWLDPEGWHRKGAALPPADQTRWVGGRVIDPPAGWQ